MANRGPGHRRTSRVESSISADAVRSRVPDSEYVPGFPKTGSFPVNDNFHTETRPEGATSGVRSNPGDKGFLYSDTPVATVFLGKKQWIGDDWTYSVDFQSAENSGRLYETQKRDILERILTRKLRWLSDHEAFSKVRSKLNSASQFGRLSEEIKNRLETRLESNDPSALTAEDFDVLLDLEAVPSGFGLANTTRYYTTPVRGTTKDTKIAEYNRKLQQLRSLEQFAGPNEEEILDEVIRQQEEQIATFQRTIDTLTQRINELTASKKTIEQALLQGRIFGSENEATSEGYDGSDRKIVLEDELKLVNEELDFLLVDRSSKQDGREQAKVLLVEYKERRDNDETIQQLREEVATLKEEAETELAESRRLVPLASFNGIVEFNNITSISTTIELNGQGSASLSLENPNNILRISRDDILLAMSNDNDLEVSMDGNPQNPVPELLRMRWTELTQSESKSSVLTEAAKGFALGSALGAALGPAGVAIGGATGALAAAATAGRADEPDDIDPSTGNLRYYKGKYYDPAGLQIALENGDASLDAKTGVTNGEAALLLNRYRRQQEAVYREISSRLNNLPPGFDQSLSESVGLPSSTALVTSEWLRDNQRSLATLLNGGSDNEEDIEITTGYQIIESYKQGLQELEQNELLDILTFDPGAQDTTSRDENDSFVAELGGFFRKNTNNGSIFSQVMSAVFPENPSLPKLKRLFRELQTHFTNKWVVEVGDRVWVWLTSPSRTTQINENGLGIVESTVGRVAAEVQNQAEIRRLQKEADDLEEEIVKLRRRFQELESEASDLALVPPAIRGEEWVTSRDKILEEARKIEKEEKEKVDELNVYIQELNKLENEISPPNANESSEKAFSSVSAGTAAESIPFSALQLSTYGGLEEQQFQVFEGIVSSVSGSFDGQAFTLNVQCRDLTFYLERTRVIERPALTQSDTIALLNDPVYRSTTGTQREVQCSFRTGTFVDGVQEVQGGAGSGEATQPTDAQGHPLAGRWKSGVYVTTALIYAQATRESSITSADVNGYTEEEISCVHGLAPYSKLYGGLDAANLISLLTTGIPFNFSLYTLNLANASTNVQGATYQENASGAVVAARANAFEALRTLVGVQNQFLGNFQPFLELTRSYNKQRLDALKDEILSARRRMRNVFATRSSNLFPQAGISQAFFSTVQLLAEGKVTKTTAADPLYADTAVRAEVSAREAEAIRQEQVASGAVDSAREVDFDSDFFTDAGADGLAYISALIKSQNFSPTSKDRLRIFNSAQERSWIAHFEEKYGSTAKSTDQVVRQVLRGERSLLDTENKELEKRLQNLRTTSRNEQESAEIRAQRRTEELRITRQIEDNKKRLEEVNETLALEDGRKSQTFTGETINLQASVTLSPDEVRAFQALARARKNYNEYRELYNQFVLNTSEALGLEIEEGQSVNRTAVALTKKFNRSSIIPTKRKIIERRKPNFLLISDKYVSDRSLQPYKLETSNANISEKFRGVYSSTFALCREAADQVDFEFYCDENGHLRFKPPTYNRVLKEHFDLELLRPEMRLQLAALFPGLNSLAIASTAKQMRQSVETEKSEAQKGLKLQVPLLAIGTGDGSSPRSAEEIANLPFGVTVGEVTNSKGQNITKEKARADDLRAGQKVDLAAKVDELIGPKGSNNKQARRDLDNAFASLSLNSEVRDWQLVRLKFQEYLNTYFETLALVNKQIEDRVKSFQPEEYRKKEQEFIKSYRGYMARLDLCTAPEIYGAFATNKNRCEFNAEGVPIRDDRGIILPEGVTQEELSNPDERPAYLKEYGVDVLQVINRAPVPFELPPGVTQKQAWELYGLNERSQQELRKNYTKEIKAALPGYLRASAERRVAISRWKEQVVDIDERGIEYTPTSWLYVNAPFDSTNPTTWYAGKRKSNTTETGFVSKVPIGVPSPIPGGPRFFLATENEKDENVLNHRDVLGATPNVNQNVREYGIAAVDQNTINSNLILEDLNSDAFRTLNGRDGASSGAIGGDFRSFQKQLQGSVILNTDVWFYLEMWRDETNLQAAVDFFRKKNLEPSITELRLDSAYTLLAATRFELIKSHYKYLKKIWDTYFQPKLQEVTNLELGNDITAQQQALLSGADEGKVDVVTALELRALEELEEQPYFLDELHVHRIPPQIIFQEQFTEKQPDYVRLDVSGKIDWTKVNEVTSNFFIWGGGVDYDLWRTYGWSQNNIERAFLHDRETAKLYCAAMLSRQKAKVFSGSVTVRGDSKYRVGDCAFMEDQFMYYYITRVAHSFNFGEYTTQLQLEYGRRPDDFIAHPFDTLGDATFNAAISEINERYPIVRANGGNDPAYTTLQTQAEEAEKEQAEEDRRAKETQKTREQTGGDPTIEQTGS